MATTYSMPSGRYCRAGEYVIVPAGVHGMDLARIAVIVAVLTSSAWAWLLHSERELHARLLAETVASQARIERLTLQYSNGVKATVNIKEQR